MRLYSVQVSSIKERQNWFIRKRKYVFFILLRIFWCTSTRFFSFPVFGTFFYIKTKSFWCDLIHSPIYAASAADRIKAAPTTPGNLSYLCWFYYGLGTRLQPKTIKYDTRRAG